MAERPERALCMEWRLHPCTKYLLELIDETITNTEQMFSNGEFIGSTEFETLKLSLKAVGSNVALEELADEIETIAQEEDFDDFS